MCSQQEQVHTSAKLTKHNYGLPPRAAHVGVSPCHETGRQSGDFKIRNEEPLASLQEHHSLSARSDQKLKK